MTKMNSKQLIAMTLCLSGWSNSTSFQARLLLCQPVLPTTGSLQVSLYILLCAYIGRALWLSLESKNQLAASYNSVPKSWKSCRIINHFGMYTIIEPACSHLHVIKVQNPYLKSVQPMIFIKPTTSIQILPIHQLACSYMATIWGQYRFQLYDYYSK